MRCMSICNIDQHWLHAVSISYARKYYYNLNIISAQATTAHRGYFLTNSFIKLLLMGRNIYLSSLVSLHFSLT